MSRVNAIMAEIDIEHPFPESFLGKEALLCELIGADLVQIIHRGQPLFAGQDLDLAPGHWDALLVFLRSRPGPIWSTDCLSGEFEPAASYADRLAGVMLIFIDDRQNDFMMFGRRRVRYTVEWGADPASLPLSNPGQASGRSWPNRTFQVWREERSHHASPWSDVAVATGLALRALIQRVVVANAAHFERLARSLAREHDQLHRSREEMRHRAMHDALTGLPNRSRFREALIESIQASRLDGRDFGVALLDIDHFKTINDTLGHAKGDVLLSAIAERIVDGLPATATVARFGGDEFALLLPHGLEDDPLTLAERLVETLRKTIMVGEDHFSITCSLGLAIGGAQSEPGELLKQADLALYRAKAEGRNCAHPFDRALETQVLKRLEIDRLVLARSPTDAVEILLQPLVPIAVRPTLRRFEVLARWRNADGGLLMPGDFIPAAERNGLIRGVTATVIRRTIALVHEAMDGGVHDILLAINASAADLEVHGFASQVLDQLAAARVPPGMLEIEISESMLLRMTPRMKASLALLDEGGIRLAVDDFGIGFSSMTYLRELPISSLKIDRELIRGIETPRDHSLVAGMIAMAHSIEKEVIAEGVETQRQRNLLVDSGCDWGQGYLWSRPLPPAQALVATIPWAG
jgi:diguanylate cyclase (GGDEF)-like protein